MSLQPTLALLNQNVSLGHLIHLLEAVAMVSSSWLPWTLTFMWDCLSRHQYDQWLWEVGEGWWGGKRSEPRVRYLKQCFSISTEERSWGLARQYCAQVAVGGCWSLCTKRKKKWVCHQSRGCVCLCSCLFCSGEHWWVHPCSENTHKWKVYLKLFSWGKKKNKKRKKESRKTNCMSKTQNVTFNSLYLVYLAPKCFLLSPKINSTLLSGDLPPL